MCKYSPNLAPPYSKSLGITRKVPLYIQAKGALAQMGGEYPVH